MTNKCRAEFYEDSSIACDCVTGECPRIKFELDPKDLIVEVLPESPLGFIIKPPIGVRITHTPTCISYTSRHKQSQHANKAAALEGLKGLLKDAAMKPAHDAMIPQGYEIYELPSDYSGPVWIESQVRYLARRNARTALPTTLNRSQQQNM